MYSSISLTPLDLLSAALSDLLSTLSDTLSDVRQDVKSTVSEFLSTESYVMYTQWDPLSSTPSYLLSDVILY